MGDDFVYKMSVAADATVAIRRALGSPKTVDVAKGHAGTFERCAALEKRMRVVQNCGNPIADVFSQPSILAF